MTGTSLSLHYAAASARAWISRSLRISSASAPWPSGAWNLHHRRKLLERGVREERAEAFAQLALQHVRVAVAVGAKRRLGVVHVERAQAVDAHPLAELADQRVEVGSGRSRRSRTPTGGRSPGRRRDARAGRRRRTARRARPASARSSRRPPRSSPSGARSCPSSARGSASAPEPRAPDRTRTQHPGATRHGGRRRPPRSRTLRPWSSSSWRRSSRRTRRSGWRG